jgi:hypothetical protein
VSKSRCYPDEIEIIAVFIRDAIRMFGSHG